DFVAVDGSGATLSLARSKDKYTLGFDAESQEYYGFDEQGYRVGFNPALSAFGGMLRLTTKDGTSYDINASSGRITRSLDAHGNIIYQLGSDGNLEAQDQSGGIQLLAALSWSGNQITSITIPGQDVIHYYYDGNGDLDRVQTPATETSYVYGDSN